MSNWNDEIQMIDKQIEELESRKAEIRREHSGLFIGVRYVGDADYWDEYFVYLGVCTADEAEKWASENVGDTPFEPCYFEVSYDVYNKYNNWYYMDKALYCLNHYHFSSDTINEIKKELKTIISELIVDRDLNIEHPSFQHIDEFHNK